MNLALKFLVMHQRTKMIEKCSYEFQYMSQNVMMN